MYNSDGNNSNYNFLSSITNYGLIGTIFYIFKILKVFIEVSLPQNTLEIIKSRNIVLYLIIKIFIRIYSSRHEQGDQVFIIQAALHKLLLI